MSRPWMPLYIADYLADTQHLTATEHGAYLLLLMHHWHHGKLPAADEMLMRIARVHPPHWPRIKKVLGSFFDTQEDGSWVHKRVALELNKATEISNKRKAAAEQKHNKSSPNAEQLDTHARASSQPQSQEEREDASASPPAPSGEPYFFESGVIRLREKDFRKWEQAFPKLDLRAELISMTEWAGEQKKWFYAVGTLLAKRNRDIGVRIAQGPPGSVPVRDFRNPLAGIL